MSGLDAAMGMSSIHHSLISSVGQHYTHSCDVFSFGMVAWEILARRRAVLPNVKKDAPPMSILYAMAGGRYISRYSEVIKLSLENYFYGFLLLFIMMALNSPLTCVGLMQVPGPINSLTLPKW